MLLCSLKYKMRVGDENSLNYAKYLIDKEKIICIDDNYSLDFNKLIPMPKDLKLDAGTIENKSISCYYLPLSDEDKFKLMKLLKNKKKKT